MQQLEDPLRLQQIAQPVLPQIPQLGPRGQGTTGQLLDGLGEQDLPAMASCQQPREPVQRGRQVVPPRIRRGFSRMQRHPHPQRAEIAPVLGQERALAGDGGPQRLFRRGEGGLGAIADGLVEDPVVGGNQTLQDGQLPIDRLPHGGPIPLPERGTALDVGEEEGDGAGGKIGHDPLQTLGWTWCCPIVACDETDLGRQAASGNARLVLGAVPPGYALGKPSPRRLSESQRPWPMMKWLSSAISSNCPAATISTVRATSAADGVGSPER